MVNVYGIDLSLYETLREHGYQDLDKNQYSKIAKIVLHVLGDAQIVNLPESIPPDLKRKILTKYLLWEEQKRSRPKTEQAEKWFQKHTKPVTKYDPQQRFQKVQWFAHSRLSFPFQETATRKNRNTDAAESYEELQVEGASLLFAFIDEEKELETPEEYWKVQRTLLHYGALVEEGKVVKWERMLVDWAQEEPSRLERVRDLYYPFQQFLPGHERPEGDVVEEDSALEALSFRNYVAKRTVRSISRKLSLTFSETVLERITNSLQKNEVMRLHFTYFLGKMRNTLHIPEEEEEKKFLLEDFATFFLYGKHCQSRRGKEYLLELLFRRDLSSDHRAYYEQILHESRNKGDFFEVEKVLRLIKKRGEMFLDGKSSTGLFYLIPFLHLYPDISTFLEEEYPLQEITLYEFFLFFSKNREERLEVFKRFYFASLQEEGEEERPYSSFQYALLYVLSQENWHDSVKRFFEMYASGIGEGIDPEVTFHLMLHQFDLTIEKLHFQSHILSIKNSSDRRRMGRALLFEIVQKLPPLLRPKIPLSFPCQTLPPKIDASKIEADLMSTTNDLYRLEEEILSPEKLASLSHFVYQEGLIEDGEGISWARLIVDWVGEVPRRKSILEILDLPPSKPNNEESRLAAQLTLHEYVVNRTLRNLERVLSLTFSSASRTFFEQAALCEQARLDLVYYSTHISALSPSLETRAFSDRLFVLQDFFRFQSRCSGSEVRNVLLEYLFTLNEDYENAYPYSQYTRKALGWNLPDFDALYPFVTKIQPRFRRANKHDAPFLYCFITKHPNLQEKIRAWPLEELLISQLLYLGTKIEDFPDTLENTLPPTELPFSEKEGKILSLLKALPLFVDKMAFLEKFYQKLEIVQDDKFAFDFLLAPVHLKREIADALLEQAEHKCVSIINTFSKVCHNAQDVSMIGKFVTLLNLPDLDQY